MCGEPFALFTVIVGFHAMVSGTCVGIKVDADEDGIAVTVGNGSTAIQGDKVVAAPSHRDRHATVLKKAFNFFGHT